MSLPKKEIRTVEYKGHTFEVSLPEGWEVDLLGKALVVMRNGKDYKYLRRKDIEVLPPEVPLWERQIDAQRGCKD